MSHYGVSSSQVNRISQRSMRGIRKELGICNDNAEQTTDVRGRACTDKVEAVSTAVAHLNMVSLSSPHLICNADGFEGKR